MKKDFYSDISLNYDLVFKANSAQVNFIKSYLNISKPKLLEVGCGTGSLALMLNDESVNVSAIDLNKDMIGLAKLKDVNNSVDFKVMSMLEIQNSYALESFDAISCVGNTLVHLNDLPEVETFFKSAYALLKNEGNLLLQIVNYDRIIDNKIDELPLIDDDKIQFERKYRQSANKVIFDTRLLNKEDGQTYVNSIELLALRKNEIETVLEDSGFKDIRFFSSFSKQDWNINSVPTIISCKK